MQQLRFTSEQIVWQEVPGEVSLAFLFSGCPLRCRGCHSADSWKAGLGTALTEDYLQSRLARYRGLISCVLFMGGEWLPESLECLLVAVTRAGLKTCLYTGLERDELEAQSGCFIPHLTYLKTGRWMPEQGGLDSPTTNQRFIHVPSGDVLNHLFIREEALAPARKRVIPLVQPGDSAFRSGVLQAA